MWSAERFKASTASKGLKVLHLLYRKEITYTLQHRFCKVDLTLNALIQLKIIHIDDGSGSSDVGM